MRFLEAMLLYCLLKESPPIGPAEQAEIDARDLVIARQGRMPELATVRQNRETPVADWALELLDGIADVARLLDHDEQGYLTAVQSCRDAVMNPELTPSARLLAELKTSGAGFFEYVLNLARSHHNYFLSLPLDDEKDRFLANTASRSAAEARTLESRSEAPLAEYLQQYFEQG